MKTQLVQKEPIKIYGFFKHIELAKSGGKPVRLEYPDGSQHVLLASGQQVRVNPKQHKPMGVSGKAARRARIKQRQEARKTV